jgi:hypothetical protein
VPGSRHAREDRSTGRSGGRERALLGGHLEAGKGATVARFMALDLARRTPPRVPQEVAAEQLAKVARVLAG